jgi:putative chitobiose transport system permease protein
MKRRFPWLSYLVVIIGGVAMVLPFLDMVMSSFKGAGEYGVIPYQFFPESFSLDNYRDAFSQLELGRLFRNSVIVTVSVTVSVLVTSSMAGYALAKLRFRGSRLLLGALLATLILPGEATIIAQYVTVRSLGLTDTLLGVALPGMIGMINVLLMRAAFTAIPDELEMAAKVDGANAWQRLIHVNLPGVRGMLSVISIFAFIGAWDDFLWPLIVLTDPENLTLTVGLQYLSGTFTNNPRLIAAGTMISFVPIVIVFAVLQRYFFRGVEEGAIKG